MLFQPLLALAQQTQSSNPQQPWDWPGPWHMMWSGGWGGGWGFWWIFPLFMFLMMIGCFGFFLFGHGSGGRRPHHSALEILNERFAKGEIQKQEYDEKKAAILAPGQP